MAEEEVIKRIPPHDDEAERSVIASMIIDREMASEIISILDKEDFYVAAYGTMYQALSELTLGGQAVDELILANKLKEMGAPEEMCRTDYITDIVMQLTTSAFAVDYANIVKNKAGLRRMIRVADGISKSCYEGSKSADAITAMAEDQIFKLIRI